MAVTITGGEVQKKGGTWQSIETLTQSTATVPQAISLNTDVTVLGMGTASGFPRNKYTLATGAVEGMEKLIISSATGEATVFIPSATTLLPFHVAFAALTTATTADAVLGGSTATGQWVFQSDGDFVYLKYMNGLWHFQDLAGATKATVT